MSGKNELVLAHRSLRQFHNVPANPLDLRDGHGSLQPDHTAGLLRPVDKMVVAPDAQQVRGHRNPVHLQPEQAQQRRFVEPQFTVEIDQAQPGFLNPRGQQLRFFERKGVAQAGLCDDRSGAVLKMVARQRTGCQIVNAERKPEMLQSYEHGLIHDARIRIAAATVHQYQQGPVPPALAARALHHFVR